MSTPREPLPWSDKERKRNEANQKFNNRHPSLRRKINEGLLSMFGSGVFIGAAFEVIRDYPQVKLVAKFMYFSTHIHVSTQILEDSYIDVSTFICDEIYGNVQALLSKEQPK